MKSLDMKVSKKEFIVLLCLFILISNCFLFSSANETTVNSLFNPIKLTNPIKLEVRVDIPLDLNLEEALKMAILQNLDIKGAEHQANLQKWKLRENIGNFFPDFSTGFLAQRFDGSFLVGGVFPVSALTTNINAFMRFDYRFFDGGKKIFNTLAAKNLYKSLQENQNLLLKDALLAVTTAYNQLLKEQAKLDVLAKSVEEAEAEVQLNKNLEELGTGTKFNVLQSQTKFAQQKQGYILQQTKLRQASIKLTTLLNMEQGIQINPDKKDLKAESPKVLDMSIVQLIEVAKENRPEIKKLEFELKAQKNNIGVALSDYLPSANFFGQYGGTGKRLIDDTSTSTIFPDAVFLDDSGNPIVSMIRTRNISDVIPRSGKPFVVQVDETLMSNKFIGIQVDWDFGNGLGIPTFSRIKQAKEQVKLLDTNLEKLNKQVEQEVRSAYLNIQAAHELIDVAKTRVSSATEALELAKARLENGVGINIELLEAQTQYTESLVSQIEAIVEFNNAKAQLFYSLGLIDINSLVGRNVAG